MTHMPSPDAGATGQDPPGFTIAEARYCLVCGNDLSGLEITRCPRCLRSFNPADATTYRDTPKPEPAPAARWRNSERFALHALFALYLCGILLLNGLEVDYSQGNNNVLGALALALSVPWLIGCIYLALQALGSRLDPALHIAIPLATALGVLFALGSPPLILGAAFLLGPFTGLLFSWRNIE